ncbi:hypothetical protein [Nocardia sp. CS682]|nr:hypothetical protein [Nocardia sp. CS682]
MGADVIKEAAGVLDGGRVLLPAQLDGHPFGSSLTVVTPTVSSNY